MTLKNTHFTYKILNIPVSLGLTDSNIKGIKVDNKEIKISLLADDISLIIFDLQSVKHSLAVLKKMIYLCWPTN